MTDSAAYEDAVAATSTDEQKRGVAELAEEMLALAAEIAEQQDALNVLVARHSDIMTRSLPEAMKSIGMKMYKLTDGSLIEIKKVYSASIPPETAQATYAWVRDQGDGAIIKREMTAAFGMGQDNMAADFAARAKAMLRELGGGDLTDKTGIHSSTLRAYVKEKYEAGTPPPDDLFKVFIIDQATVKLPRPPKPKGRGESGQRAAKEII